ncbi:MAG: class I SAM-dependent methyltransferase [Parcubacteria group bacterium]|nr:class I SAM-dependent methyltransferase [Parcubacteria group bacterium]MCR4342720.1 class I SAM-dependent methyltransferase [Patescibacteria group bacterium]
MNKRKRGRDDRKFWNKEYKEVKHLSLSSNPSEDLLKFIRWLGRKRPPVQFDNADNIIDVGCGNGRNLVYLSKTFGASGVGIDISKEAIAQAKDMSKGLPLEYRCQSIADPFLLEDESCSLALDMMASHVLKEEARERLLKEVVRVLKPGGWFFFKTFLLDEDRHAERLLRESPSCEEGTYIHPKSGTPEHVFTEEEIEKILDPYFTIHKISKSHRHILKGKAFKRRSISVYAEKKF